MRPGPRLLLALAVALALAHALSFAASGPLDDDYIYYRYARNLVAGRGLVHDAGERVEGFTSPGWVLALAGAQALGLAPAAFSKAAGALASALAALALGLWWRARVPGARWPVPALLLALAPAQAFHATAGLATTAIGAALAVWLWRFDAAARAGRSPRGASAALGLAMLLRPEAAVFALPFAAACRGRARLVAALSAAPLGAWCAFRLAYYGRWLPITYGVKKLPLAVDLRYGLAYLAEATLACGAGVTLALALWLLWRLWPEGERTSERDAGERATRAAALGLGLHALVVVLVGGDYMPLARFFVPVLPLALGLAALAVRMLLGGRPRALRAACALACALSLAPERERGRLRALHEQHEERWLAVGDALARACPPGTSVAVSAIGAIGWASDLPIVDMLGLTDPRYLAVAPDLRIPMKGHQRHDAELVLARDPALIVPGNAILLPGTTTVQGYLWEERLLAHPALAERYVPMQLPVEGSTPLVLLVRRGTPAPAGARPYAGGG